MSKEFVQHDYKIDIDDKDNSKRKYYLNDEVITYPHESEVKIGSLVYFDRFNQMFGIVQQRRRDKYFNLYDVMILNGTDKIEEVAEFRVYKVAS